MLATVDDHKVILESYNMPEIRESSANLLEIIRTAIALAKEKYDANVYGVVSDNAPSMTCMGAQLEPEIMYTTCHLHTGNLLAKDLISSKKFTDILKNVMAVQKDFKKPGLESRLTKLGGKKSVLYFVFRFASTRDTIESFLGNLPVMKRVASNEDIDNQYVEESELKNPNAQLFD